MADQQLSPQQAVNLVREWWTALGNNQQDKVLELLHEDIIWEVKFVGKWLPSEGVSRGKQAVAKNCIEMFGLMYDTDRLSVEITNMISDGRSVVIEFFIDGYTASGAAYEKVEYVSIVELEGSKVKHVREYMDALKATSAHQLT
ncbi:hypothetical protein Sphch_3319 [Sphingobium chlorophenolicum L-1]|uniref:SnoaL-like domain-containing protein n=1 Tax=Sphingobium chlorophenolicum L-1 TaxID=690566 RepID=F6F3A5_SPHCR|nr:nuclear transport factor 2 family protein [Sphingobium chlorophenolicum]AEG50917.1 hypothetical protein Sphch_3319 [Sphingobium chlorophenolicum L-1]